RNCSARANPEPLTCLRIAYGRTCGFVSTATASLNEMWASALAGQTSSAIVVLPGARSRPLLVRVTLGPVDGTEPAERDLLMLLPPPAASAPASVALQRLFGLTGTEARVLELLLRDRCPREIAGDLGVSITTIRSHIRALFGKTGTRRQSELATLAWS